MSQAVCLLKDFDGWAEQVMKKGILHSFHLSGYSHAQIDSAWRGVKSVSLKPSAQHSC